MKDLVDGRATKVLLYLILGLALARGVIYASVVPPWQAPDEPKHFEYVALLEQSGRLVTREDASPALQREIITSMRAHDYWRFGFANSPQESSSSFADIWRSSPSQLDRPPLYYLAASTFYRLSVGLPVEVQLYFVRLFSVLLGVITVLMVFLTVRTIFPKEPLLALAASCFVAFLPMHSFLSGSVNSDNLANLLAAMLAYVLAQVFARGASFANVAGVLLFILAGFWTKRTTLFALPIAALALPMYLGIRRSCDLARSRLRWIVSALVVLLATLVLWEAPRNGIGWVLDHYVFNYSASANLSRFLENDYTPLSLLTLYMGFAGPLFDSFWAQFGWMNVRLDPVWYVMVLALSLLSLLGVAKFGWLLALKKERLDSHQARVLAVFLAWIMIVVAVTLIQYTAEFSPTSFPQGRYLFPALVPIALLFVIGLRSLFPKHLQAPMWFALMGFLFLFDSVATILHLLPFYYQLG